MNFKDRWLFNSTLNNYSLEYKTFVALHPFRFVIIDVLLAGIAWICISAVFIVLMVALLGCGSAEAEPKGIPVDITTFHLPIEKVEEISGLCYDKWHQAFDKPMYTVKLREKRHPYFEQLPLKGWIKHIYRFRLYAKRNYRRGKKQRVFVGFFPGLLDEDGTWWYAGAAFPGVFRKYPKRYAVAAVYGEEYNHIGVDRTQAMADTMCHEVGGHSVCSCDHQYEKGNPNNMSEVEDPLQCLMFYTYTGHDDAQFCWPCINKCSGRFKKWRYWRK